MDQVTISSRLEVVTVYARGAICIRRLAVAPVNGRLPECVRVGGLPLSLRPGSLRARALKAPDGFRILSVKPRFEVETPPEGDLPTEQAALEEAGRELARLEMELAQVRRELAAVAALRPDYPEPKRGERPRDAPVDALLAVGDFVQTQLALLNERKRSLEASVVDARNAVELRQRRIAEASSSLRTERTRLTRAAVIEMSGAGDAPLELALEYLVPGARWSPSYDLRLDRGLTSGRLALRASVAQRTGEDWSQVKLSLSTANLERRTETPELRSLRIGRTQPAPPRSGWRAPPPGLDELFAELDAPPPPGVGARAEPEVYGGGAAQLEASKRGIVLGGAPMMMKKRAKADRADFADAAPMAEMSPGRPPPPAKQMAAPPPPPAAQALRRSATSGAGMPAAAAPAPMKEMASMTRSGALSADLDEAGMAGADAPQEPEPGVAAPVLDYDRLRMKGAREASRGRLVPEDETRIQMVALAQLKLELNVLVSVVAQRQADAERVAQLPLPSFAMEVRDAAGSFDHRYDATHRVDVAGDGQWHLVPITSIDVTTAAEYVCVPSVEDKVYRTVNLTNRSAHPLLAGPVDVTLGDEFLLTGQLPSLSPNGVQRTGLGVEEAIRVARNTRFRETTGGLLGNTTVLHHEIEIELSNQLAASAPIEVRERVPLSSHADIKIEETPATPPWKADPLEHNGQRAEGARVWKVQLKPGEKTKLVATYAIRIPGDKMLDGGNRRV